MKIVLKTLIRNFIRRPVINLINLFGLSVSLTMVIILSLFCYSEFTTDRFHVNANEVYLLKPRSDGIYSPGILTETIKDKIPGLKSVVRIAGSFEPPVFQVENNEPIISDLLFADADFFKLFTYKASEGDLNYALNEPMCIIITEGLAKKLFGEKKALGRIIKFNNRKNLTVTAVLKEQEHNTCLNFNALTSIETKKNLEGEGGEYKEWGWNNFQTFFLLEKGINAESILKNILSLIPAEEKNNYSNASLISLRNIYFSEFNLFGSNHLIRGNEKKTIALLMVAFLILTIALVNFINISTAQWQERIKLTGVLKVLGAKRAGIIRNIIAESFLFFLAALFIAIQISEAFAPSLNNYSGIGYNKSLTGSGGFIIISLVSILLLSILFSIFPALKISTSRAVDNLKKSLQKNKTSYSANGVLIIMQFSIAIALISFTVLVQKQVRFGSSNLGMNQDNIIGIKLTEQLNSKKEVLKSQLEMQPAIKEISLSQYFPGKTLSWWGTQMNLNGVKQEVGFDTFSADAVLFKLLGLELISGRFYSDSLPSDIHKIIVNEEFLKKHNITNPLGATLILGMMQEDAYNAEIIGVVKDFHYKPFNQPINPLAIRNDHQASYCMVQIQSEDFNQLKNTMDNIKGIVAELSPSFPVEVSFFDKAVENMYQSELQFRRTFSLLSACALVICCLGILAMSIFSCQRRVKEIGIRKINGATVMEIMIMLNKDFVRVVVIAFVIASPVAWYSMHKWLETFAYRTTMSWWIFVLAGLIALIIAFFTVSWQSWRAATRNPVEALRYE